MRTPAQKRRAIFKSKQDWIEWGLRVLKSAGGAVVINGYSEKTGSRDLWKALMWCRDAGLVEVGGKPSAKWFQLKEDK